MRLTNCFVVLSLLAIDAAAQLVNEERPFEDGYSNQLLYVHALVNYAFDLEWQYEWERTQFAANALRINTGSVSSDKLLTDVDISINEALNAQWRFSGQFTRNGQRQLSIDSEQLLVGFERALPGNTAMFVTANPEYDKSALDAAVGFALYRDAREQYLRVSLLMDDMNYGSKNTVGGSQRQDPLYLQWALRWLLADGWYAYSEGRLGRGFERTFEDDTLSPTLAAQDQRDQRAELRVSKRFDDGNFWSVWAAWNDFRERRAFRTPSQDFSYSNRDINIAVEHVRLLSARDRLRLLSHYVDREAGSDGFNAHRYERQELLGGAFYERLRGDSAWMLGYAFGLPELDYAAADSQRDYDDSAYTDKLILGWRYAFSPRAQVRASISHEVSASGFGGGAVQFQMAF